jgi:bacterial/archaeal transporter family protein
MNGAVLLGGVAMLIAWGVWGLAAKVATNQIGMQALLWGQIAAVALFPVYFLVFKELLPLKIDAGSIAWAIFAGALGVFGTMMLYVLLRAAPASIVIPLSALYPVVTVLLAFFFLHEELSFQRIIGIVFALAAIWLLST